MTDQTIAPVFTDTPIRPPFDPELEPIIETLRGLLGPLADNLHAARQMMSEGMPGIEPPDLTAGGKVRVEQRRVPGPAGDPDITLLILRPAEVHGTARAGIYHTHGGGMVTGDCRTGVEAFLPFVAEGKAVVVSVEYRLAPEHPDPAPIGDCYAGLVWTADKAAELGIDPARLMIAGTSAGGGLAAGTALMARDRNYPKLSHQILICPMLDDRFETHSSRMLDGEGTWDRNDNLFGWVSLLGERRGTEDVSPYSAPARAESLAGLPRTYIDCGSAESFRDEALAYAQRLSQAGVSVDFHMWGGGNHGFDIMAPQAALSQASIATREEFIRRALEA